MLAIGLGKLAARAKMAEMSSGAAEGTAKATDSSGGGGQITSESNTPLAANSQITLQGQAMQAPWGEPLQQPPMVVSAAYELGVQLAKEAAEGDFLSGIGNWWSGLDPKMRTGIVGGGLGMLAGGVFGGGRGMLAGGLAGGLGGYAGHDWLKDKPWFQQAQGWWSGGAGQPQNTSTYKPEEVAKVQQGVTQLRSDVASKAPKDTKVVPGGVLSWKDAQNQLPQVDIGVPMGKEMRDWTDYSGKPAQSKAGIGWGPENLAGATVAEYMDKAETALNTPLPTQVPTHDELLDVFAHRQQGLKAVEKILPLSLDRAKKSLDQAQRVNIQGEAVNPAIAKAKAEVDRLQDLTNTMADRQKLLEQDWNTALSSEAYTKNLEPMKPEWWDKGTPAQREGFTTARMREGLGGTENSPVLLETLPYERTEDGKIYGMPHLDSKVANGYVSNDEEVLSAQTPEQLAETAKDFEANAIKYQKEWQLANQGITDPNRARIAAATARDSTAGAMNARQVQITQTEQAILQVKNKARAGGKDTQVKGVRGSVQLLMLEDKLEVSNNRLVELQRQLYTSQGAALPKELDVNTPEGYTAELEYMQARLNKLSKLKGQLGSAGYRDNAAITNVTTRIDKLKNNINAMRTQGISEADKVIKTIKDERTLSQVRGDIEAINKADEDIQQANLFAAQEFGANHPSIKDYSQLGDDVIGLHEAGDKLKYIRSSSLVGKGVKNGIVSVATLKFDDGTMTTSNGEAGIQIASIPLPPVTIDDEQHNMAIKVFKDDDGGHFAVRAMDGLTGIKTIDNLAGADTFYYHPLFMSGEYSLATGPVSGVIGASKLVSSIGKGSYSDMWVKDFKTGNIITIKPYPDGFGEALSLPETSRGGLLKTIGKEVAEALWANEAKKALPQENFEGYERYGNPRPMKVFAYKQEGVIFEGREKWKPPEVAKSTAFSLPNPINIIRRTAR